MKLLIVTITAELPRYYEYYESLDRLKLPVGTEKISIHSSSPAKNRNIAIKTAMQYDFTHLLFTDDDHIYPPNTVIKLLERNVDIVSGMYTMKFNPFPIIAMKAEGNLSSFVNMNQYGENELIAIDRVPAGCLLVSMDALKKIGHNWFTLGQYQVDEWGDDIWFSDRARLVGLQPYIDTGVQVGHMTKVALWPAWNGNGWDIQFKVNEGIDIGMMKPNG